jgi:hypothetical protein
MFEIIPPGIWLLKISVSTPVFSLKNSLIAGTDFSEVVRDALDHIDVEARRVPGPFQHLDQRSPSGCVPVPTKAS